MAEIKCPGAYQCDKLRAYGVPADWHCLECPKRDSVGAQVFRDWIRRRNEIFRKHAKPGWADHSEGGDLGRDSHDDWIEANSDHSPIITIGIDVQSGGRIEQRIAHHFPTGPAKFPPSWYLYLVKRDDGS